MGLRMASHIAPRERSVPSRPWEETPDALAARLRQCFTAVNADLNVEQLCRDFPKRIAKLVQNEDGRLRG